MSGSLHLLEIADEILRSSDTGSELEQKLELYSREFDQWYRTEQSKPQLGLEQADLEALLKKHQAVLDLAERCKADISECLRALKRKGRAIITYATDGVPKRISTIRTRKL